MGVDTRALSTRRPPLCLLCAQDMGGDAAQRDSGTQGATGEVSWRGEAVSRIEDMDPESIVIHYARCLGCSRFCVFELSSGVVYESGGYQSDEVGGRPWRGSCKNCGPRVGRLEIEVSWSWAGDLQGARNTLGGT